MGFALLGGNHHPKQRGGQNIRTGNSEHSAMTRQKETPPVRMGSQLRRNGWKKPANGNFHAKCHDQMTGAKRRSDRVPFPLVGDKADSVRMCSDVC